MKHYSLIISSSLVLGAGALTAGCDAQGIYCQTAHGAFAVKLTLKTGTGECSEMKGGVYGVQTYNYPDSSGRPDPAKASMAIQADDLGVAVANAADRLGDVPDPANLPYAKGDFGAAVPDKEQLCAVPTLTKAIQNIPTLPAIPADPTTDPPTEAVPAEPATSFTYEWTNMAFLVSEAASGNQFRADLSYTHDGCTATYEAWGLYPAVGCGDADGNPDVTLCDANADPEHGRSTGSGISPDFVTVCDPDLLLCVLTGKPPIFK